MMQPGIQNDFAGYAGSTSRSWLGLPVACCCPPSAEGVVTFVLPRLSGLLHSYRRVVSKVPADTPGLSMDESATGIVSMWIADVPALRYPLLLPPSLLLLRLRLLPLLPLLPQMMPVTLKVVAALNQALPHEVANTMAEVINW